MSDYVPSDQRVSDVDLRELIRCYEMCLKRQYRPPFCEVVIASLKELQEARYNAQGKEVKP
jgi:hypothetical protein